MSRLPHSCLTVKLPIMEKPPPSELTPSRLGFPTEFPYDLFSPGFTSPDNSTETEEETSDDEEDFLAGLTRRLAPSTQRQLPPSFNTKPEEKRQFVATSPQSTLSGLGSYSNSGSRSPILPHPQPLTSSRRDSTLDVISAAAGEVAKLKMGSYESHLPRQNNNFQIRRDNSAFLADLSLQEKLLFEQMWLCSQSRAKSSENYIPKRLVNQEVAYENLRYMRHNALSNATCLPQNVGTPLKRPSAGTGVFLPRRYPTNAPSVSHKKQGLVNTAPMLQSKVIPQNLNFDEFIAGGPRRSQLDYECMLARSTIASRQGNLRSLGGGNGCLNQERRLPQYWMY